MYQLKKNGSLLLNSFPQLILFIGSFIYLYFFASYILFYQEEASLFIFSTDFLLENLHQPGGFIIYAGKFISTFFSYPAIGALMISGVLIIIVTIVTKIIKYTKGNYYNVIPLVFGLLLFYLQTDYRYLEYNTAGLLVSLSCFYLSIKYLNFLRGWFPVLLSPIFYFLTGGFVWLYIFLLSSYIIILDGKKGLVKIAGLFLICFLTLYISREFLFFQTGETLLLFPFSEVNTGTQSKLFFAIVLLLSFLPLIARIKVPLPDGLKINHSLKLIITIFLAGVIITGIGLVRFDKKDKQYFEVEKLFYQDRYKEMIEYNRENPTSNYLTIFLNNIALCETGNLNDMLFHFSQDPEGKTLFLKWEMLGEVLKRGGYFYYTIGMVNEAHRWAFENMVMKGHSPEGIKMLIKTDLINGNYEVASSYINILKKTLFYRREAKVFENLLFNAEAIKKNKEPGEKISTWLETDFFAITDNPFINIEHILLNDSLNKKAFEYKIALMLLRKNYQGIIDALPAFERFNYSRLPVHVEEALVTFSAVNKKIVALPGSLKINERTELKWKEYLAIIQKRGNDPKAAEPVLRKQFGNTFWYWVMYK